MKLSIKSLKHNNKQKLNVLVEIDIEVVLLTYSLKENVKKENFINFLKELIDKMDGNKI